VTGGLIHQGLHVDENFYWCGAEAGTATRVVQVARADGAVVNFDFDLALSRAGATYGGNITPAVYEAGDIIAIRATDTTTARDYIFIGSWSAFKASPATWVATEHQ